MSLPGACACPKHTHLSTGACALQTQLQRQASSMQFDWLSCGVVMRRPQLQQRTAAAVTCSARTMFSTRQQNTAGPAPLPKMAPLAKPNRDCCFQARWCGGATGELPTTAEPCCWGCHVLGSPFHCSRCGTVRMLSPRRAPRACVLSCACMLLQQVWHRMLQHRGRPHGRDPV